MIDKLAALESEFLDTFFNYEILTGEDFVDFFMVYYEFVGCFDMFETVEEAKAVLLTAFEHACKANHIEYEQQYPNFSRLEIKKIWWYLELTLVAQHFKVTRPTITLNAIENLKNRMHSLSEETLDLQMILVDVMLEDIPFEPRPSLNLWEETDFFKDIKDKFSTFYNENEKMFSLSKLKNGFFLPHKTLSKFLSTADLVFDVYVASLFEVLKFVDEDRVEQLLEIYVNEFFKNSCIQKLVKKEHKKFLLEQSLTLAEYLLEDIEEENS